MSRIGDALKVLEDKYDDRAEQLLKIFLSKYTVEDCVKDYPESENGLKEETIDNVTFSFGGKELAASENDVYYIWDVNNLGKGWFFQLFDITDGEGNTISGEKDEAKKKSKKTKWGSFKFPKHKIHEETQVSNMSRIGKALEELEKINLVEKKEKEKKSKWSSFKFPKHKVHEEMKFESDLIKRLWELTGGIGTEAEKTNDKRYDKVYEYLGFALDAAEEAGLTEYINNPDESKTNEDELDVAKDNVGLEKKDAKEPNEKEPEEKDSQFDKLYHQILKRLEKRPLTTKSHVYKVLLDAVIQEVRDFPNINRKLAVFARDFIKDPQNFSGRD